MSILSKFYANLRSILCQIAFMKFEFFLLRFDPPSPFDVKKKTAGLVKRDIPYDDSMKRKSLWRKKKSNSTLPALSWKPILTWWKQARGNLLFVICDITIITIVLIICDICVTLERFWREQTIWRWLWELGWLWREWVFFLY